MISSDLSDKIVSFDCKILNFDCNFKHNTKKKVKLTPYTRRKLAKSLKNCSVTKTHKKMAMLYDDVYPPVLPTAAALTQMKHEQTQHKFFDKNPIISIILMRKSPEYKNVITHFLVHLHFCLHYWTPQQIENYSKCSEKKKITLQFSKNRDRDSYLEKRCFEVKLNAEFSKMHEGKSGIPQGCYLATRTGSLPNLYC